MSLKESVHFFTEFLTKPKAIGSVIPSSRSLATRIVDWVDWDNLATVVEYGPGTGAITREISPHVVAEMKFIAIEVNSSFVRSIRNEFPDARVYEDSVGNVKSICEKEGLQQVDAVVSGLPWSAFSEREQTEYLDATLSVLKPGGQFVTYGYWQALLLPGGQRFRKLLQDRFSQVDVSDAVWWNVPPAFVYFCRR